MLQLERKSFEISLEILGNKEVIKVLERGWGGNSTWITFPDKVLFWLIENLKMGFKGNRKKLYLRKMMVMRCFRRNCRRTVAVIKLESLRLGMGMKRILIAYVLQVEIIEAVGLS